MLSNLRNATLEQLSFSALPLRRLHLSHIRGSVFKHGMMPRSLKALELQNLDVEESSLSDLLKCVKLRELQLYECPHVSGREVAKAVPSLRSLEIRNCEKMRRLTAKEIPPRLTRLVLDQSSVSRGALDQCSGTLADLTIRNDRTLSREFLTSVAGMQKLKMVSISAKRLRSDSLRVLRRCTALREIHLGSDKTSSLCVDQVPPACEFLKVSRAHVYGGIASFGVCRELVLVACVIDKATLRSVALQDLLGVSLVSCGLTDSQFAEMVGCKAKRIDVSMNGKLTIASVAYLKSMPSLREVVAIGCSRSLRNGLIRLGREARGLRIVLQVP